MANKIVIPLQSLISCFLNPLRTGKQQWVQLDSGRGYLVVVAQGGWGILCPPSSLCQGSGQWKLWAQVRHLVDFPVGYEGDSSACFFHCFFLPPFSSSLHLCHCLQIIGQVTIFPFLRIVLETFYLSLGLKPIWQGLCVMLSDLVVSDWDLSLAKIHGAWF